MNRNAADHWGDASLVATRLAGSWSFDRVIEGQATMQGRATFTPLDDASLAYCEQGTLRLPNGTELQAQREYIFRTCAGGFDVFFKEAPPRLFHRIALHGAVELTGDASHLCNLDTYRSTYSFRPDGQFTIRHVVSGPRKDYTMTTVYSRSGSVA
ncbi:hypothetical protein J6500_16820 [Bradyrhizobium sp. WSM 1704]|uniref:DUF6314 family protein n=1 Tax=Bradyrhizobium semiaridum TaxID=2821404 RepID=UPI001CE26EF4|nr:DUF6314 family protein [Bradyrhizobium semiaridum]MCA6123545.1 hypothetical protein [Bradyrhizobium semiaridum]